MRMSTQPEQPKIKSAPSPFKPWYRHGWVWFLIGIPGSAVVAGSITMWLAVTRSDSLVADDYYKEGRAINQRLEKDQVAVDQGIRLESSMRALPSGMQRIEVRFAAKPGVTMPEFIRLRLSHPTLDQMDVLATLMKSTDGVYRSEIAGVATGRWYAQLEDDQSSWRIKATWVVEP